MGVTIDNLQIEIQSSSTNAAKGIDALAKSLEGLKKNGSFKAVSTNLNNLSTALEKLPNVHSASNALRTLANSIEKLKSVGTVASLANSLKKLPQALKSLESINLSNARTQIQDVADAVYPLTQVRNSGFSSMVNSMAKLKSVTDSLNSDTINKFAEKIKKLNEVVEPFAAKMGTIKTALGGMNTQLRQTKVSTAQVSDEVNISAFNFSNLANVITTVATALQSVIQGFTNIVHSAAEWDGISARFGRGFGTQAQETYEWIQRLNEEMGINIQQAMQHSSIYANMLTGFGVVSEDAQKMALGYTELTYDIWAGYNDIYKTYEEAAEAVRSAIAGEVEPIRRAGFTIIESTLQQTAANHGLEISLEKATEAEKSYLRYLTLVDQAHSQNLVGTYAKELNTAEGMMRMFSQQVKSLAQAFGSLFLPVLVKVMPYFQAFVELLTEGVFWLANMFGIEIQKVDFSGYEAGSGAIDNVTDSAGEATDALGSAAQAAKELKNATLGIDELNVISPPSASSGAGSGGAGGSGGSGFDGIDVDSLWDESIFDNIQSQVDELKEKIRGWLSDIAPVIAGIGAALAGWKLTAFLDDLDKADIGLKNIGKAVSVAGIALAVGKLVWDFTGAYLETADEKQLLKALGATVLGTAIAAFFAGKTGAAIVLTVSGIVTLTRLAIEISKGTVEFSDPEAITTAIVGLTETVIGGVFTWKLLGPVIKQAFTTLGPQIAAWFTSASGAAGSIASAITAAGPWALVAAAILGVITLGIVDYDFTDFGHTLGEMLTDAVMTILTNLPVTLFARAIGRAFTFAIEWAKDYFEVDSVWELIGIMFDPDTWTEKIIPLIKDTFVKIGEAIQGFFENLAENIGEFQKGFIDGVGDALGIDLSFLDFLTIGDVGDLFASLNLHARIFDLAKDIGEQFLPGLIEGIKSTWESFSGQVEEKFGAFVDGVKDLFGIHSPSTVFADIGKNIIAGLVQPFSVNTLKDKMTGMWNAAKSWWDSGKEALKNYTPSIGSISTKLSSAWESAKTWWNDKKGSLKTYTPTIGSIYEKLKERWDNARIWWNDKKTKAKEYTPSIGSIYEKLKERWDNARTWWNSKKSAMNSYTPSIGSITDKVKSAWNSAKSWWSKNVGGLSTKLNVSVPTIKVNWETATAFGKSFKYPTGFSLKFAADGGIFDKGSLIWAGERGPEVMATAAGGKTGVMNVQQMQDAVYEGVYAAVSAAMRGKTSGGTQSVNVYLDGRKITASVEQHQHERGATIMGNEVYAF